MRVPSKQSRTHNNNNDATSPLNHQGLRFFVTTDNPHGNRRGGFCCLNSSINITERTLYHYYVVGAVVGEIY